MGIKCFNIEYDGEVFYLGQTVSGRVRLSLDQPKILKDGSKFELESGDHVYPFSISLPAVSPPSFYGTHGSIGYYGEAKLDLPPWTKNKCEKKTFYVEVPIDLNSMPELNQLYENEESKTFCCWLCASRPLTVFVSIPRTGFAYTDVIPITIEVENASDIEVSSVKVELNQIINWEAKKNTKSQKKTLKKLELSGVGGHMSHSWSGILALGPDKYPHSGVCSIILINYEVRIELDVRGPHRALELKIPIVIGTMPYRASFADSMGVVHVPTRQALPLTAFGDLCGREPQLNWLSYVICGLFCACFLSVISFMIYGIIQIREHRI